VLLALMVFFSLRLLAVVGYDGLSSSKLLRRLIWKSMYTSFRKPF
jgi:hypothetical protein